MDEWKWISDWSELEPRTQYLVCAIRPAADGSMCLAHPKIGSGTTVKETCPEGCYLATEWKSPKIIG